MALLPHERNDNALNVKQPTSDVQQLIVRLQKTERDYRYERTEMK